jgi:D-arabinose 1-dehydrogenase-like Zn-dependent alcohol dehydrogenase
MFSKSLTSTTKEKLDRRLTLGVAVVGIGGLGHLAVQYLAHWGCEVTAINSSRDKEEQARSLGASRFIATRGTDELSQAAARLSAWHLLPPAPRLPQLPGTSCSTLYPCVQL